MPQRIIRYDNILLRENAVVMILSCVDAVIISCCLGSVCLCLEYNNDIFVPASPDQGHDRPCRRDVGRVFLAGVRPDSPSRRRIPSCYRPGPGRGMVVELGQRGAH